MALLSRQQVERVGVSVSGIGPSGCALLDFAVYYGLVERGHCDHGNATVIQNAMVSCASRLLGARIRGSDKQATGRRVECDIVKGLL